MAYIDGLTYTKDWTNPADFPTYQSEETQVREDIQLLYDEIRNYINTTLVNKILGLTVEVTAADGTTVLSQGSIAADDNGKLIVKLDPFVLPASAYGDTLPVDGVEGQVFFQTVAE